MGDSGTTVLVGVVVGVVGLFGVSAAIPAAAAPATKVVICHATSSATNPFVQISVALSAVDGSGKNDHSAHANDIIPPVAGLPGRHWDERGQAIFAANCRLSTVGDADRDGIVDRVDPDDDNDAVPDAVDPDDDGDGIPDVQDPDDDNDGTPDQADPDHGGSTKTPDSDRDRDGSPDSRDSDDDGDGIPDVQDPDDDNDGTPDTKDQHLPPVLPPRLILPTSEGDSDSPGRPSSTAVSADDTVPGTSGPRPESVDPQVTPTAPRVVADERTGREVAEIVLAQERSLVTDAGEAVAVSVSCRATLRRSAPMDAGGPSEDRQAAARSCRIVHRQGNVVLRVPVGVPMTVSLRLQAPAIGDRAAVDSSVVYRLG